MQLKRPNWQTGERTYREVNERVVQEIIDIVLGRQWLDLVNDEHFEYRRRRWASEIEKLDPVTVTAPAGGGDLPEKVRALQAAGKSITAIKAATGLTGEQVRAILEPQTVG